MLAMARYQCSDFSFHPQVTRPFQEEKAIGIMRLIDAALPPLATRGGVKGLKLKNT